MRSMTMNSEPDNTKTQKDDSRSTENVQNDHLNFACVWLPWGNKLPATYHYER